MRRHLLVTSILAAVLPLAGIAGGFSSSHLLNGGVVAVTNAQANSSWATAAVLVKFNAATNGTVTVRRVSQGATYTLSACSFTGASNLVWVADREYSFGFGMCW